MTDKANFLGFNHVALEVGDIEEALEFYGKLFEVKLRGRSARMAFIDAGTNSSPSPKSGRKARTPTGTSGSW